jgi:hypothetical protein
MNAKAHSSKFLLKNIYSGKALFRIPILLLAVAALITLNCSGSKDQKDKKIILSFYVDDTSPGIAGAEAYGTFLDYCKAHGIKGESTVVLGYDGESMADDPDPSEQIFLEYAEKSYESGIDTHMEIMTHHELFDFETGKKRDDGIHEGLWLHEPAVVAVDYRQYFENILANGERAGVRYTGLTWPGCGCEACSLRYAELREAGPLKFNPAVWDALIDVVAQGKFRTRVIPIFYEANETEFGVFQKVADGAFGVYDLMPNAMDYMGIWENNPERVDPDYYITEDGKGGIIIDHLEKGDPYCLWYMHWQGLNPEKGVGWEAFRTVIGRIENHLGDRVVWLRPSDIVTMYHDAGGWGFVGKL